MGVREQMTCPVSKIKLGPEARYKSRYFHLSFQLPAEPTILAGVDRSLRSYAELCGVWCFARHCTCEGYSEAHGQRCCGGVLQGQLVRIDGDIGVCLKPSICLKKSCSGGFHYWFSHCWPSAFTSSWQNTMLRYHHLSLQTLHCLKNWENTIFTPYLVIEARTWFKIPQICKNLFRDSVGFASRLNAL